MNHKRTKLSIGLTLVSLIAISAWLVPAKADSLTDGLSLSETTKLTASDGQIADRFGSVASIHGDTIVVGVNPMFSSHNAAYIYYRNLGGLEAWGQKTKLSMNDAGTYGFGKSVAISTDTAAIGANGDAGQATFGTGAAYIFERNAGGLDAWGQVKKITASDGNIYDRFGSVALDGDTLVVGAPGVDDSGESDQGAVYIFYRNQGGPNNWGQVKKITASDAANNDQMGFRVALDGDVLVAGAHGDNSGQGAAYVFYRNQGGSDAWGEVKKLVAADGAANDFFGAAVSVSGEIVVSGAYQAELSYGAGRGAAYVYQRDSGGADQWSQVKKLDASDFGGFGWSVAVDGEKLLIGAPSSSPGGIQNAGTAYLFLRKYGGTDAWGETDKAASSDAATGDFFGFSVDLDNKTASIGAAEANIAGKENQGAAYIYSIASRFQIFLPRVIRNACSPLYSDDFNNPNSGWPVGDDGENLYEYSNGEYHILVRPAEWDAGAHPGFQASDYFVSVDLRNPNGVWGSYGIAFGIAQDWSTFYTLEIYPNGSFGIYRWDPGGLHPLIEGSSQAILQDSATNEIQIERNQASIKAYANGQLLASVTDETYTGSRAIGLIVFSYDEPDVDIRFENFTVYPIGCGGVSSPSNTTSDRLIPPGQHAPNFTTIKNWHIRH